MQPQIAQTRFDKPGRWRAWRGQQREREEEVLLNRALASLATLILASCAAAGDAPAPPAPQTVTVPAGPFIGGSDWVEREAAYYLDEAAYGRPVTREQRWYENEGERRVVQLHAFEIMKHPVTNRDYVRFVRATGHPAPHVEPGMWQSYRVAHPYNRAQRYMWENGGPPQGRADHPVVLVSYADAEAYAAWLSRTRGERWRLPTDLEWEKAARGTEGWMYPWGDIWKAQRANTHDIGPFDTMPVGSFPDSASPYGMLDAAGQVFEWTSTTDGNGGYLVKGGSWDDKGCGVCRPAAGHGRPEQLKHILIGFRLVREVS
jgi:formylglycine-generating enzyme required for sulfatase activity